MQFNGRLESLFAQWNEWKMQQEPMKEGKQCKVCSVERSFVRSWMYAKIFYELWVVATDKNKKHALVCGKFIRSQCS